MKDFFKIITLLSFSALLFNACEEKTNNVDDAPAVPSNFTELTSPFINGTPAEYNGVDMDLKDTLFKNGWGLIIGKFSYPSPVGSSGKACILSSSDKGKSWGIRHSIDDVLDQVKLYDNGVGYFNSLSTIYSTFDYGSTLSKFSFTNTYLHSFFVKGSNVIVGGQDNLFKATAYVSYDNAASFKGISIETPSFTFNQTDVTNIVFHSPEEFTVYGKGAYSIPGYGPVVRGFISSTLDSGKTWVTVDSTLVFPKESKIIKLGDLNYAVAFDFIKEKYVLARSIDGISWQIINVAGSERYWIKVVAFKDFLYVLSEVAVYKMDLDGNVVRTFSRSNNAHYFTDIYMLNENEAIVTTRLLSQATAPILKMHP